AAALEKDGQTAVGIETELAIAVPSLGAAGRSVGKLHGVAAFRIIRAADEGAEFAELQRELAAAATGAAAGVRAVRLGREDVVRQKLVEGVQHLRNAQVLDLRGVARKLVPELPQHFLVVELAVGDFVELF